MSVHDMSRAELQRIAADIAVEVGAFLVDDRPDDLMMSTKSSATDVVTQMDAEAERMITSMLHERRPGDGILGEEGARGESATGITWVVDPIDGTTNYLYRLPLWTVSIAAREHDRVVAGVVHAPELGTTYGAILDGGAWRTTSAGTSRLASTQQETLAESLIATGFGYTVERRRRQGRIVAELIPLVRDIRRGGAASLDLCWVASGITDAYYELGLRPWDIAAGALIAEEAGARVRLLDGTPWQPLDETGAESEAIVASAPGIHDALTDELRRIDAMLA